MDDASERQSCCEVEADEHDQPEVCVESTYNFNERVRQVRRRLLGLWFRETKQPRRQISEIREESRDSEKRPDDGAAASF